MLLQFWIMSVIIDSCHYRSYFVWQAARLLIFPEHVVAEMRRIFEIDNGINIVLESHYALTMRETLSNLNLTLDEAGIGYGHHLVISEKPANNAGSKQHRQDLVTMPLAHVNHNSKWYSREFSSIAWVFCKLYSVKIHLILMILYITLLQQDSELIVTHCMLSETI